MRPRHELFLDAVAEERQRLSSRRSLLRGSATVAGAAVLAGGLAVAPAGPALRTVMAQAFTDDLDILNYALTLEHLEYAFYRDGLDLFGASDFGIGVYDNLILVRDHELAHVQTLTQVVSDLGGTPVQEAAYDFGYGNDPDAFLVTAAALENTGVSAYDGAGGSIQNSDLVTAAGTIVAVEARHASYLNLVSGTDVPFPAAFETPLSREEVLNIAGGFFV